MTDPIAPAVLGLLRMTVWHHREQAKTARFPPMRWWHRLQALRYETALKAMTPGG